MAAICRSRASLRGFWKRYRVDWWRILEALRRGLSFRDQSMVRATVALTRHLIARRTGLAARTPRRANGTIATKMRTRVESVFRNDLRGCRGLIIGRDMRARRQLPGSQWTILPASLRREDRRSRVRSWRSRNRPE